MAARAPLLSRGVRPASGAGRPGWWLGALGRPAWGGAGRGGGQRAGDGGGARAALFTSIAACAGRARISHFSKRGSRRRGGRDCRPPGPTSPPHAAAAPGTALGLGVVAVDFTGTFFHPEAFDKMEVRMAKGDPKKPKGKMSAYAFFVQTCREEHKKKNPEVPVNFAEFSKKCSERWKTMSGKEKSKFDEMAKADKVRYDREMKDYGPAKGGKKKKDPNAPKRPPSGFFLFCSEFRPKIKSTNPGISIGDVAKKLGEMWNNLSDSEKQPYITKAAKLKEKYEKPAGLRLKKHGIKPDSLNMADNEGC
ncbi:high mobility group protein B3 isoform X1 [Alexandromys fortis]|uniref:high mobility group protein B3 isoform X1 n=1 Tax=Alexandromys fortis TaxID=100897 RepID=UPI002152E937|nr:high mobility group protein B3 isoform X1 [Microtus fortis]